RMLVPVTTTVSAPAPPLSCAWATPQVAPASIAIAAPRSRTERRLVTLLVLNIRYSPRELSKILFLVSIRIGRRASWRGAGGFPSLAGEERHQIVEFRRAEALVIVGRHQRRQHIDRADLAAVQEMQLIVLAEKLHRIGVLVQQ